MKALVLVLGLMSSLSVIAAPRSSASVYGPGGSRVSLNMSGGLATVGGDYGGSFLTGVLVQVDRTVPVRLGLDTGIMFGSGTGLPILASLVWKVRGDGRKGVQPYIGGAVGPVIGLSGAGAFAGGGFSDGVKLAILLRPGLSFPVADLMDLKTEITVGGLTGIFYIAPMLGMAVHL